MATKKNIALIPRDVSWMYFNYRILQEAKNTSVPLLERLSFLGIYSNNLDEFFRVRVATLARIAESDVRQMKDEIENARKTIKEINKINAKYNAEFEYVVGMVTRELAQENIRIINETELNEHQQAYISGFYRNVLAGFTNPQWMSFAGSLAGAPDDSIYLAVKLTRWREDMKKPRRDYAIVRVPVAKFGRFVALPQENGTHYIMYLDDVIRFCLPHIFASVGYDNFEAYSFKFTKDAELEVDNVSDTGVMQKIQHAVRGRRHGQAIRVVYDASMPRDVYRKIMQHLSLDKFDTTVAGGRYQNHKDFMAFPDCGRTDLKYPKWQPLCLPEFTGTKTILELIQEGDRFLHVPYHAFDHYIQLLCEAAISPKVKAIKTTLYRLARDSKVVEALIAAAKNGKKVTVVIELLARFDESSNVKWSKRMKEAGINVIFGVEGLKVHSKLLHIEMSGSRDIACVGTGNFHEGNAKTYTDCMLMTAAPAIVRDVLNVFNFIEKPFMAPKFRELLVSPNTMKKGILSMIQTEIRNKRQGKAAYIKVKVNHITDEVVVKKLYEAADAGVSIDLLVRGNCTMTVGEHGMNSNIRIHGIIDKYLEHSRILIFCNDGNEKYYIGSADWMTRNLDHRIEVLTPVYNPAIQNELKRIVEWGMEDNRKGRIVDGLGHNEYYDAENPMPLRSQERLYNYYREKCSQDSGTQPEQTTATDNS